MSWLNPELLGELKRFFIPSDLSVFAAARTARRQGAGMGLVSKAREKALLLIVLAASACPFANSSSPSASHAGQAFGKVVRLTSNQIQIQSPDAKTPLILVVQSAVTLKG